MMDQNLGRNVLQELARGRPWPQLCAQWPELETAQGRQSLGRLAHLLELQAVPEESWLLDEIVEHIPEMLFVKDAEQLTFARVNRAAEQLLGISRQEMLGKTDFDFFPIHEARFFQEKDRQVLNSGQPLDIPLERIQTRQGARCLHTQKIPILDSKGEPRFLVGISRDITDYVLAQEEIARSQQQLRLLAGKLQQAQEDERQRLARELHDELGQVLTGVKIELAWMLDRLPEEEPKLQSHLEQAHLLVDSALATVRRVATALRPQILDDLGLREAVDWLLQEICGRAQIQSSLLYEVHCDLNSDLSTTVYRVCQEALTNVVRHAKAQNCQVRIYVEREPNRNWLVAHISDDGCGLAGPREGALGLLGLRERVQLHGGQLELGPGFEGRGTRLSFRLPM